MGSERLLLLSNSKNYGMGFLEHAEASIKEFLGPARRRILFIPYAGVTVTFAEMAGRVGERFGKLGYELTSIHEADDPVAAVSEAEAIAVSGGNTFHLLHHLHEKNLIEPLRRSAIAGVPYIGWSAGSNVACPSICTTNDMPIVQPRSFDALGLVPFQINPHYLDHHPEQHQGETREQRIAEFVEVHRDVYVLGLREGSILCLDGGKLILCGGKKSMRVFHFGEPAREVGSTDDLSFLFR